LDRRLMILTYNLFLGPFGGVNVIISMMGVLQKELGTTLEMVTLSIAMAMFPFAIFQFFTGALADTWDAKKTIVAGMSAYCAAALICGLAPNIWVFMAGRFLQGVGLAFVNPVSLALVGEIVRPERRGYVMGWMGTINTLGIALGPLAGGIAAEYDWRYVYYLIIAMSVISVLLFQFAFGDMPKKVKAAPNIIANLKRVGSMTAIQLVCMAGFMAFFAYGANLTFVSDNMEGVLHYSPTEVGTAISLGGVAGILASPVAGWSSDRFGRVTVSAVGFLLVGTAYALFSFASSIPQAVALFALVGAGQGFVWAGIMTLSVELVPEARGTSSTLFNGTRFTGYSIAPIVLVPLYLSYGLVPVLMIAVAMSLAGLVLVIALRKLVPVRAPAADKK